MIRFFKGLIMRPLKALLFFVKALDAAEMHRITNLNKCKESNE